MKITSSSNPKIKKVVGLKQRKMRDQTGLTVVDGLREVARAKEAGVSLEEIYICQELFDQFASHDVHEKVLEWGKETFFVSKAVFEKICFGERKEGIVAIARLKKKLLDAAVLPKDPLVVVLDQVEKPGNLGAILRSCDGAGVDAVIVADTTTDIFSPNVIRASTGVVFSMAVAQGSPDDVKDFLKKKKIKIFAAAPQAKQAYFAVDLTGPAAFILGSEDKGLSDFWLKEADECVAIPMRGKADSLNVSVTAAVLVYEALRQRNVASG